MSSWVTKATAINLLSAIQFWIGVFFLLHFTFITIPPLEPISTWRQTDGLMVARNFHETDGNILYPRVDVAGEKTGIVGCEFPLLNYFISLLARAFGYEHWYGRLISLIISSIGVYFFYKLVYKYFGKDNTALFASILILVSIWFTYCRTNIPDTFGLSLCLIALYFGLQYLETGGPFTAFLFFVLALAGTLAKITTASILAVLAIPFFFGVSTLSRRIILAAMSVAMLSIVSWWYFVWVPHLNETFGFHGHFFMGLSFEDGFNDLISRAPLTLKRFYSTAMKYSGFVVFLLGIYLMIKKRSRLAFSAFAISFMAALVVIVKTGYGLHVNAYYMIIFMPAMAFAAGYGLANLKSQRLAVALLIIVSAEGLMNQVHILQIREPNRSLTQLEGILDRFTKSTDLIVVNGSAEADPTPMYFAHRKGWVLPNALLASPERLSDLQSKGCKVAVISKQIAGHLELPFPILYDTETFRVYDLK
jgi:4-amino-4-deoxy-L-arabinose transferase-like glycosyltransferase